MGENFPSVPLHNTTFKWSDLEVSNIVRDGVLVYDGMYSIEVDGKNTGYALYPSGKFAPQSTSFHRLRFRVEDLPTIPPESCKIGVVVNFNGTTGVFYGIYLFNSVMYAINADYTKGNDIVQVDEIPFAMALTDMDTEWFYLDIDIKTSGVDIYVFPATNPDGNGEKQSVSRRSPTTAGMMGIVIHQNY